jgi:hypothetical protein
MQKILKIPLFVELDVSGDLSTVEKPTSNRGALIADPPDVVKKAGVALHFDDAGIGRRNRNDQCRWAVAVGAETER